MPDPTLVPRCPKSPIPLADSGEEGVKRRAGRSCGERTESCPGPSLPGSSSPAAPSSPSRAAPGEAELGAPGAGCGGKALGPAGSWGRAGGEEEAAAPCARWRSPLRA